MTIPKDWMTEANNELAIYDNSQLDICPKCLKDGAIVRLDVIRPRGQLAKRRGQTRVLCRYHGDVTITLEHRLLLKRQTGVQGEPTAS